MIQEAAREIKVKTTRFSLKKGKIILRFFCDDSKGKIVGLKLKQRNVRMENSYPFELKEEQRKSKTKYSAKININDVRLEVGFWDIVARVKTESGEVEAVLGGQSTKLKIRLILFPRWTRTGDGHLIYPFVNGARQFTIQYRKYDKKYDSYLFIFKEYLALFCYFILKPYWDRKKIWLICEKFCAMAQDNGFYFFKYCMENLEEKERNHILYVIDKKVPDYRAVEKYDDNVISFMSFRYMIYLCAAQYLISTDAIRHFYIWDSPNSVYKVLYQARKHLIFLQHGVMGFKQCHRTYHKSGGNRAALFVVSSEYERNIIEQYFEYDREDIIITGLPRWDVLRDCSSSEHREILLMPTWRSWLENASENVFRQSEYYRNYEALLNSSELIQLLEEKHLQLNFYIHPKFRDYIGEFMVDNQHIKLIPFGTQPLNMLLMKCSLLITDYSSVAWDDYYQEKPIIFYPFDMEDYNKFQGSYMDLNKEAFGDVVHGTDELLTALRKYIQNGFVEEEVYKKRRDYLLPLRDNRNSERIYQKLKEVRLSPKLKFRSVKKEIV